MSPIALAPSPLAAAGHAIDPSTWGALEWAGYGAMALVCVWVLWRAVRTTVHPGEDEPDHVKRSILDDEDEAIAASRRRPTASTPPVPGSHPPPPPPAVRPA